VISVQLTVHRATQQIGGNCVELSTSDGHRVIAAHKKPLERVVADSDLGGGGPERLFPRIVSLSMWRCTASRIVSWPRNWFAWHALEYVCASMRNMGVRGLRKPLFRIWAHTGIVGWGSENMETLQGLGNPLALDTLSKLPDSSFMMEVEATPYSQNQAANLKRAR